MTIHLTNSQLIAAAARAYDEGILTAQNGGECVYYERLNNKDCFCAIGAALPRNIAEEAEGNLYDLVSEYEDLVSFENYDFAKDLQLAHDSWAEAERDSLEFDEGADWANEKQNKFKAMIGR